MLLTPRNVEVLTAHVRQDVGHAISVMLVTAMLASNPDSIDRIKNATNILMSSRYQMMSDIYADVFEESCPAIHEIDLAPRYHITDRRIVDALVEARSRTNPIAVLDHAVWAASGRMPFVFAA